MAKLSEESLNKLTKPELIAFCYYSAGLMLSTLDVSAWKWLEYLKVFQQVTWKKLFLKFWRKLGWKFQQKTLCMPSGWQTRTRHCEVFRKKDCQQVPSVKKDIKKITTTGLDLSNTTIKLYLKESLCPYYRILWSKSKALFTMGKVHSYLISNGSVKIRLQKKGP